MQTKCVYSIIFPATCVCIYTPCDVFDKQYEASLYAGYNNNRNCMIIVINIAQRQYYYVLGKGAPAAIIITETNIHKY